MARTVNQGRYDIAIIGAGFAGSILAHIMATHGRSVALIDAVDHPRFAIGESSTPIADKLLQRLAQKHGIDTLAQLSTYASWQSSHPELACGLKRGFSYYRHVRDERFCLSSSNSLLVAASPNDDVADTHWYRSEVDEFLFDQAASAGVTPLSNHRVTAIDPGDWIKISLNGQIAIEARIAIDASGPSSVMANLLNVPGMAGTLKTNTRSTFAHFVDVASWSQSHWRSDDPFDGDHAAQHHLMADGWMWMLRFNNGITSVGMTTTGPRCPTLGALKEYPQLDALFAKAKQVAPPLPRSPITTRRLQRFYDPIAAPNCWMLPTAAVAIDPLHSTGIAHALAGIDRLADLMLANSPSPKRISAQAVAAEKYAHLVRREAKLLDQMIASTYQAMDDFSRFATACQMYFIAAIRCEEQYQRGDTPEGLFGSDDEAFTKSIQQCVNWLTSNAGSEDVGNAVGGCLHPYNQAGLFHPQSNNRYRYTATK